MACLGIEQTGTGANGVIACIADQLEPAAGACEFDEEVCFVPDNASLCEEFCDVGPCPAGSGYAAEFGGYDGCVDHCLGLEDLDRIVSLGTCLGAFECEQTEIYTSLPAELPEGCAEGCDALFDLCPPDGGAASDLELAQCAGVCRTIDHLTEDTDVTRMEDCFDSFGECPDGGNLEFEDASNLMVGCSLEPTEGCEELCDGIVSDCFESGDTAECVVNCTAIETFEPDEYVEISSCVEANEGNCVDTLMCLPDTGLSADDMCGEFCGVQGSCDDEFDVFGCYDACTSRFEDDDASLYANVWCVRAASGNDEIDICDAIGPCTGTIGEDAACAEACAANDVCEDWDTSYGAETICERSCSGIIAAFGGFEPSGFQGCIVEEFTPLCFPGDIGGCF